METKRQQVNHLRIYNDGCNFEGYDPAESDVRDCEIKKINYQEGNFGDVNPFML